jgi:hypothetical protein
LEPGQTPEFDEFTSCATRNVAGGVQRWGMEVHAGQAVLAHAGEWVRYSTPLAEGAEYIAVCVPAFSPASVHRDS